MRLMTLTSSPALNNITPPPPAQCWATTLQRSPTRRGWEAPSDTAAPARLLLCIDVLLVSIAPTRLLNLRFCSSVVLLLFVKRGVDLVYLSNERFYSL